MKLPAPVRTPLPALLLLLPACSSTAVHASPAPAPSAAGIHVAAGTQAGAPGASAPAARPDAGALEIGDPYFPGIGNGGYDVEHYDLVLDLDMASDEVEAQATVRARALHELASFALDLYGLDVERVLVDGKEARFERPPPVPDPEGRPRKSSELVIHPAEKVASGALFTTEVRYGGMPGGRPDPAVAFVPTGVGWMRRDSGVYVVSECIGASSWYPCNDHPRDKATYSFRVTVEKPYTAAANGVLREVLDEGAERTFVFEARDPMASYLATLNVAEFGVLEDVGPRGIPIRIYHPTDATEDELDDFKRQAEVLAFMETVYGPYPFEAAGGVLSYEKIGGALECQTLPVYGRGCGLDVIVHELAHQWFGNCVSPDLWRDMWLNEGFASYASWLWDEHVGGRSAYEGSVRRAYGELRQRRTGSPFDPGVGAVFSGRVYTRGAMVLHGLRTEVGDELFFRTLKSWVELFHDGNASTLDFVRHAGKVAGRDLGPFFDAWLFAPVTPEIPAWEPIEPPAERRPRARDGEAGGG